MRLFNTLVLAILSASGVVTAVPVAQPHSITNSLSEGSQGATKAEPVLDMDTGIEIRANTPADVKKHDENHKKMDQNKCGQNCKDSLASYHSQASKDSKASKASQASKNSKKKNGRSRILDEVELDD
ncbi:hypothetical protein CI238_11459 [Colletotrichum incanum]|uniref:Uncharacterized protein n=1 Tax=Colletotrichum incanum TaxID=1573173 RepID=A0A166QLS8_COLIC|nr:hypothetical protein CI238_11459 [Colletotrichum incanum]OHW94340.1 hypothetical protein CSPAE12_06963 [Colletotrichum incanum]